MTTSTATHTFEQAQTNGGFGRALRGIGAFFQDIARARRAAIAYEALSRLSDADLAARGLSRSTIAKAAFDLGFERR